MSASGDGFDVEVIESMRARRVVTRQRRGGKRLGSFCLIALLASLWFTSPQPHAKTRSAEGSDRDVLERPDEVARFMAGLPQLNPESPYLALERDRAWREHRASMDKHWARFEAGQLAPMKSWQSSTFGAMTQPNLPLFYPFSGPDFVNAHMLYPKTPRYIMVALENVRRPPDFFSMSTPYLWKALRGMVHALRDLYSVGYFITSHMSKDLVQRAAEGAVPSLMVLVARTGHEVVSAETLSLDAQGALIKVDRFKRGMVRAMRLVFRKRGSPFHQELIYFDVDLSTEALAKTPEFLSFLESQGPLHTFVKAASYLMATPQFSTVRSWVINRSRTLFQDDTGVPFRHFDMSMWVMKPFGDYAWPISGFGTYTHQPELMALYKATPPEERPTLPFSMGYHHFGERRQSHMFLKRLTP